MSVIDLKTNREILDFKFEGYKLSLDSIPILKQKIDPGVQHFVPGPEEYSYVQVDRSSHFNHLFQDPWCLSCVFYINKQNFVCWNTIEQERHLSFPLVVFELPTDVLPTKGNASISFPSEEWALVTNGIGTIFLLHTPSRQSGEPWTLCHTYLVSECESSCYLLDSLHKSLVSTQELHCLMMHFVKDSDQSSGKNSSVCNVEWLSFTQDPNLENWTIKRVRRLKGSSALLYAALERKTADSVYIASETVFEFVYDSEIPVVEDMKMNEEPKESPLLYSYLQTPEDITVVFRLTDKVTKNDIQVQFQPNNIDVIFRGESVLQGELAYPIDCHCSTWIISEERLELILCKAESGIVWNELVKGDKRGDELMDPALIEKIHNNLAHLTSETEVVPSYSTPFNLNQLEECDSCTDTLTFRRIDGNSHKQTHMVHMGGHQWLFSMQPSPESLPALCLRHDVDGLVWQPKNVISDGELDQFQIEHISTFSALGYVQASKQDKKFAACSPTFDFAAISDCARHIYVYRQPESLHSDLQLRNRRTGETVSHVAKQHVVNLENCNEILGFQISTDCIFVLSDTMLYAIKMK